MMRVSVRSLLLLIALAGLNLLWAPATQPHRASADSFFNDFAVDADPATSGIQSSIKVPVGASFQVSMVITQAQFAYSAYRSLMIFDRYSLQASGGTETPLGAASNCSGVVIQPDRVFEGCSLPSGGLQYTQGTTATISLVCQKSGTHLLALVTDTQAGSGSGTGFIISTSIFSGYFAGGSQAASVTCTPSVGGIAEAPFPVTATESRTEVALLWSGIAAGLTFFALLVFTIARRRMRMR